MAMIHDQIKVNLSRFFGSNDSSSILNGGASPSKNQNEDSPNAEANQQLTKMFMAASPLRSKMARAAAKAPETSTLRADAPVFVPQFGVPTAVVEAKKEHGSDVELPPVISVRRMATKGCAIVLLRSKHVFELSVAMKVAVIDGVCVEVRKHSRKPKEGEDRDEELGVFIAWGHRVARRVEITEEGIENYFNGLDAVKEPEDLEVTAPFKEELQRFDFSSKFPLKLNTSPKPDVANHDQMLSGPFDEPELLKDLWDAKERLEEIWQKPPPPMGRSLMQRVARDELFPHSGKEGDKHENRAGEKLEELANEVGLLKDVPKGAAFLDLCGGPGAWSQYLLSKKHLQLRGFGFTLRSGSGAEEDWQAEEKDDWYPDLLENPEWTALWGADGTGDLLKPKNLIHSTNALKKQGGVFLCVADGGFSDKTIPDGLLELYFYRLFLAELLTATNCLQPGGRFVCKLYTSCSTATSALLFLTTRLFEQSSIVKPMTSRVAGPERYLYCSGFKADSSETQSIRQALMKSQEVGAGASPLQAPLLTPLVSAADMKKDEVFMKTLRQMVIVLLQRQAGSLNAQLERAAELEEIALDAAEEAVQGGKRWAGLAAAQREERQAVREAAREARDAERGSVYESRRRDRDDRRGDRGDRNRNAHKRFPNAKVFH
eukprot:TRINITY_DN49359_c0_g1_i1.p1 TRINITY_DN49359_c0_g1~~TRINITY_DN49359_c0_g1_i1.p1  ORF type:complete len:659 (-),score=188.64 TRINITY_DN49359_c0_g1_i1:527-2503(-)